MRVISLAPLRACWDRHEEVEDALRAWYSLAERSNWSKPEDVRDTARNARILPDNRVVFAILNNRYRIVAKIHYNTQVVYVRFVGTHAEYDAIDAESV
jgi:mRNA interferase HigB